jgi:SAM-dependent methyltransferase
MDDQDGYFGEGVTARYDESLADMCEPGVVDAVVEVLAGLAGGGHALELGIGTGRIALPLARRGVAVHGIDLSRAMVARLRAKPGGEAIGVTIGDFATAKADGTFTVAYLVFNTDHESDNSGGAGGLLPQRRGSPRPRRLLRHRGHDP